MNDTKDLRNLFGCFATGVTVVTTLDKNGNKVGMTANSFSSLSLNPPLLLWSIAKSSSHFSVFVEADYFAVHILTAQQEKQAKNFSQKEYDRFGTSSYSIGIGGCPLIDDCYAVFECRTFNRVDNAGDHVILIGEIEKASATESEPLIFHKGKYASLS